MGDGNATLDGVVPDATVSSSTDTFSGGAGDGGDAPG